MEGDVGAEGAKNNNRKYRELNLNNALSGGNFLHLRQLSQTPYFICPLFVAYSMVRNRQDSIFLRHLFRSNIYTPLSCRGLLGRISEGFCLD